ncbi:MAG: AEC family transporter, partial [Ruminiclostridium sp.]
MSQVQIGQIQIIINQIIILTLLGIIGFVAGKKKYLPEDTHKYISALILKITMPFLIFTTMGNYSFTNKTLANGVYIFVFGVVFILIAGLISLGQCKVMGIKEKTKNIYITQSMFGNVIFIAYPLL